MSILLHINLFISRSKYQWTQSNSICKIQPKCNSCPIPLQLNPTSPQSNPIQSIYSIEANYISKIQSDQVKSNQVTKHIVLHPGMIYTLYHCALLYRYSALRQCRAMHFTLHCILHHMTFHCTARLAEASIRFIA